MIRLDSPEWANLEHAYGCASDIPGLLLQLGDLPSSEGNDEPWFSLWSALAHQGDVYSASYAAVPHIVRVLATAPTEAFFVYFQFPAWVEICRQRHKVVVPERLSSAYFEALKMLGMLVGAASAREWDRDFLLSALSAMAVSKGFVLIAEAVQELDDATIDKLLK